MENKLNTAEENSLPIFRSLTNNNVSQTELIEWMNSQQKKAGELNINWLKIAVSLNSKDLVKAVFSVQGVTEVQAKDAIDFGATLSKADIKIVDNIGKNMVEQSYSSKHAQQSPSSTRPDAEKSYASLSTLDYLKEKIKDVFNKKRDTLSKISELREHFGVTKNALQNKHEIDMKRHSI